MQDATDHPTSLVPAARLAPVVGAVALAVVLAGAMIAFPGGSRSADVSGPGEQALVSPPPPACPFAAGDGPTVIDGMQLITHDCQTQCGGHEDDPDSPECHPTTTTTEGGGGGGTTTTTEGDGTTTTTSGSTGDDDDDGCTSNCGGTGGDDDDDDGDAGPGDDDDQGCTSNCGGSGGDDDDATSGGGGSPSPGDDDGTAGVGDGSGSETGGSDDAGERARNGDDDVASGQITLTRGASDENSSASGDAPSSSGPGVLAIGVVGGFLALALAWLLASRRLFFFLVGKRRDDEDEEDEEDEASADA